MKLTHLSNTNDLPTVSTQATPPKEQRGRLWFVWITRGPEAAAADIRATTREEAREAAAAMWGVETAVVGARRAEMTLGGGR